MFALGKLTFGSGISSPSKSLREPSQDCQRGRERWAANDYAYVYAMGKVRNCDIRYHRKKIWHKTIRVLHCMVQITKYVVVIVCNDFWDPPPPRQTVNKDNAKWWLFREQCSVISHDVCRNYIACMMMFAD